MPPNLYKAQRAQQKAIYPAVFTSVSHFIRILFVLIKKKHEPDVASATNLSTAHQITTLQNYLSYIEERNRMVERLMKRKEWKPKVTSTSHS